MCKRSGLQMGAARKLQAPNTKFPTSPKRFGGASQRMFKFQNRKIVLVLVVVLVLGPGVSNSFAADHADYADYVARHSEIRIPNWDRHRTFLTGLTGLTRFPPLI